MIENLCDLAEINLHMAHFHIGVQESHYMIRSLVFVVDAYNNENHVVRHRVFGWEKVLELLPFLNPEDQFIEIRGPSVFDLNVGTCFHIGRNFDVLWSTLISTYHDTRSWSDFERGVAHLPITRLKDPFGDTWHRMISRFHCIHLLNAYERSFPNSIVMDVHSEIGTFL